MPFDPKALKKLAKACREAGITSYKCAEFEFTLSDTLPLSNYKKRQAVKSEPTASSFTQTFESDALVDDQLLFWSTANTAHPETGEEVPN